MNFGLPLELITMLGSGLLGGIMSIWSQTLKARQQEHVLAMEALSTKAKVIEEARRYENSGFQFTRRIIALIAVCAIIVWPKVAPVLFPEVPVTVGWTEWKPGFLFFEGRDTINWRTIEGLVLTPLDTHLMSAIVGLYFGASITRNAR
jgi:hypothetical protein